MTTINITGNHTHDTTLARADIVNVWGTTEMSLTYPSLNEIINLEPLSHWVGGFTIDAPIANFLVRGGLGATFQNTRSVVNGTATIDANVTGTGSFVEDEAHGHGKLEFVHSVSAGQTVTTTSSYFCNGVTQVDDPSHYHASNVLGFGEIILEGLRQITSYSLQNDLLLLYRGNTAVYGMRLSLEPWNVPPFAGGASNFGVSQTPGAIDIHADNQLHLAGIALGVHP